MGNQLQSSMWNQAWNLIRTATLMCSALILVPTAIAHGTDVAPPAVHKLTLKSPDSTAAIDHLSLVDYQARLESLEELVAACQQSSVNCSSDKVGRDLTIDLQGGPRSVGLGWLRTVLDQAAQPAHPKTASRPSPKSTESSSASTTKIAPPSIARQLQFAQERLRADKALAAKAQAVQSQPLTQINTRARTQLTAILAAKEYHTATAGRSIKDRVLEKIANWIDRVVAALVRAGSRSKWIGVTAEIGFVVSLAIVLVWFLIRLERQGRFGPSSIGSGAGIGAASERDWRLWAEDARQAASLGAWRDAIHYLYWSSISRLESSGLWPADRARTPREYLALLAQESTQRPTLAALTRDFERSWYAGRSSTESDYRQAEHYAASLSTNSGQERSSRRGQSR